MEVGDYTDCCGLEIISNMMDHITAESAMRGFQKGTRGFTTPFVVFAMPTNEPVGERFAKLIEKFKLGDLHRTKAKNNPNSGNDLVVYTWTIDWKAVRAWGVVPKKRSLTGVRSRSLL